MSNMKKIRAAIPILVLIAAGSVVVSAAMADDQNLPLPDAAGGVLMPPPPDASELESSTIPEPTNVEDAQNDSTARGANLEGGIESHEKMLQDKTFKDEGWQPEMGWNRLVPGKSKLADIENVFGKPGATWDTGAMTIYHFADRTVEAEIDNKTGTLTRLRISSDFPGPPAIPKTVDDAVKTFGRLKFTMVKPNPDGHLYERPGLTVSSVPNSPKKDVKSIRFYNPEQSDK